MRKKIKINKEATIGIPTVPNFIEKDGHYFHISDFSEQELRTIGGEWMEELVRKSKIKRALNENK